MRKNENNPQAVCDELFNDMIGNNIQFKSPFKDEDNHYMKKYIIYNDFTASGKSLKRVENFIYNQVLPNYANVHSTVGHNAEITSKFLHEAKELLRDYTNAYGNYSIIFHGQGATGGVHKLIEILSIKKYEAFYEDLKKAFKSKQNYNGNNDEFLKNDLIKEIKDKFNELFININYCFKFKKRNKYIIKCILCKITLDNEGDYHKHLELGVHKKYLQDYINNKNKDLFVMHEHTISDFIDVIRTEYDINNDNSLLKLIDDYEKFKPVIFYSLFEHNSNSLSWNETQSEIITISTDNDDFYESLKYELKNHKDNYIKIGSFTASSNITGLLLDVDKIAVLMHEANGYAFFDYAAGAPYLQINANDALPDKYRELLGFSQLDNYERNKAFKDGIFFSPHKFIGGPETPGVLIAHDRIYRNQLKPTQPGGGTVNFVYNNVADYIQDVELKEESGTPNIIGSIRLGIMISIRQKIPHDFIITRDEYYIKLFLDSLEEIPNLYILHNNFLKNKVHIPVFSFVISFDEKLYHPNYICALLNDLFGIQSRPGCSCAPNYGRYILGFDKDNEKFTHLQKAINEGNKIFKPGYIRLNLPYFYPEYVIRYVIKAIKFICENAYFFLGLYYYEIKSGKFYHYRNKNKEIELSLKSFDFSSKLPKKEDYIKNSKELTELELELDKIYQDVNIYTNVGNYLVETFQIGKDKIFSSRTDYENFGQYNDARWFLVYQDVKELLRQKYELALTDEFNDNNYEEQQKLEEIIKEKINKRKNDWEIKY